MKIITLNNKEFDLLLEYLRKCRDNYEIFEIIANNTRDPDDDEGDEEQRKINLFKY